MSELTLNDLATRMAEIDFAMLSTRSLNGKIAARPMSNNRDVKFDGDSYYFTLEKTHMVQEIEADPVVALTFTGSSKPDGAPPFFVAAEGRAELIREKPAMKSHWNEDIEKWFAEGFQTPGIVLIKVSAERIHYWAGEDEGELTL
ncbi:pyridoxamine 5'-phosphate oxidase family protein [Caballeronia sp. GAWG1-5s-s]|uniref:pyridoxamine 5'-phosphate oxidase family protein n=1 Tax=Caballeronia sp. GAWG1-5s-s TaxID=2921743 RepID=UPI0025402B99|nr:pyridoxamine 5'-phosphate oxidase family protein [Caballeronia sp. GAWG1-5s-s]